MVYNDTVAALLFLLNHMSGKQMMVEARVAIYNAANHLYTQLSMDERYMYHSIADKRSEK